MSMTELVIENNQELLERTVKKQNEKLKKNMLEKQKNEIAQMVEKEETLILMNEKLRKKLKK